MEVPRDPVQSGDLGALDCQDGWFYEATSGGLFCMERVECKLTVVVFPDNQCCFLHGCTICLWLPCRDLLFVNIATVHSALRLSFLSYVFCHFHYVAGPQTGVQYQLQTDSWLSHISYNRISFKNIYIYIVVSTAA